jgi:RNA polymerase-associated protein LEO1
MSDSDEPVDVPDEGGDDLFGDEEIDEVLSQSDRGRAISDNELASDPEDGYGRMRDDEEEAPQVKDKVVMSISMYRHRIPKSKDGQVCKR